MELDDKRKHMKALLDSMPIAKPKGGARPNSGRPVSTNPAKQRSLRFTDAHWEKLKRLGGAQWVIEKMRSEK